MFGLQQNEHFHATAHQSAVLATATALAVLGGINLAWHAPLLQWQPLPQFSPLGSPIGVISGLILLAAAFGLVWDRTRSIAAWLGAAWIACWIMAFQCVAWATGDRQGFLALLGIAECGAMALGLATIAAPATASLPWRIAFGACLITFGISHFAFAAFTATLVPQWLPSPLSIAYLTGAVHTAAGIAVAANLRIRLAAAVEATMMTSFVLLVHLPAVMAQPSDRVQLTMAGIAMLLTCSTWLVATSPVPTETDTSREKSFAPRGLTLGR